MLISGIHNYCDKWCERCSFTTRCAVGVMYIEDKRKGESDLELDSPEFWKKLQGILADTFMLVRGMAKKHGVDVDAPIPEEYWIEKEKRDRDAKNHPCSIASRKYKEDVRKWLDSSSKDFERKTEELEKSISMSLPGENPRAVALEIRDAVDIVIWYHTVIYVKIMRALSHVYDEDDVVIEDFPRDCDGSAKVALVSIGTSIKAWETLMRHFQDKEDDILEMLSQLQKLGRIVEQEFPDAWSFKRPGFDD